ncbi:MAG: GMP/IMP nucleotidase [Gammaproteobacteria bacterium]|nr:GMP/IMP nucleotidase [Gammaproteobacteria bacterium]
MTRELLQWDEITTVMLDMDGTLLDLHFDNHFWLHHVPLRYAEKMRIPLHEAKRELQRRTEAVAGRLEWYCLDYWSRELDLDIALLKEEVSHLIQIHPHVIPFLSRVKERGHPLLLVTNAHHKSLALKLELTHLGGYFNEIITTHDFGLAKENPNFWQRLQQRLPFEPKRTLFVDDSLPVLTSAHRFGIRWLVAIDRPDSRGPQRQTTPFSAISSFESILPPSLKLPLPLGEGRGEG